MGDDHPEEDVSATHRKRLAQILRYIGSMHHALHPDASGSFVREKVSVHVGGSGTTESDFFQREDEEESNSRADGQDSGCWGILFSSNDFGRLLALLGATTDERGSSSLFGSPPFSFYAASSSSASEAPTSTTGVSRKRTLSGTLKRAFSPGRAGDGGSNSQIHMNRGRNAYDKACWLRLTRMTTMGSSVEKLPEIGHPDVRDYVDGWLARTRPECGSVSQLLLDSERLTNAPKIPPTVSVRGGQRIQSFLRKCKRNLQRRVFQRKLEPIYNRLFEWIQQQDHYGELVWGLGHARMRIEGDGDDGVYYVNGPLLEVLVEVELSRDGALLICPREHTGVTLNREVVSALTATKGGALATGESGGRSALLSQLHQTVAELEASHMSPGQPSTYVPLLKRIAVELSAGGRFLPSSSALEPRAEPYDGVAGDPSKLLVTEAWCLFSRPKPSSVWARDAVAFADQLMLPRGACSSGENLLVSQATWPLTHGPGALDAAKCGSLLNGGDKIKSCGGSRLLRWLAAPWKSTKPPPAGVSTAPVPARPLFPLPTSDAQNRIADLLLSKNYPAVVCEGPPGTGKTHSIANMICAYLCQGKRVLVTSKNAPALAVLRRRLPSSVQELCVDVSVSESTGIRQLQRTVERLANRISCASIETEADKCRFLESHIADLENELQSIDEKLSQHSEEIRSLFENPEAQAMIQLSMELIEDSPWLMEMIPTWSVKEVSLFRERVASLVLDENDPIERVGGFGRHPSDALVSLVASRAGEALSMLSITAKKAMAYMPLVGSTFGLEKPSLDLGETLNSLTINGKAPSSKAEWKTILRALRHAQALDSFERDVWKVNERKNGWPRCDFSGDNCVVRKLHGDLLKAVEFKELTVRLNVADEIEAAAECHKLDKRRSLISSQIRRRAEALVDATVITELSRSFSAEAQSALIRFAQIAGKAKFRRAAHPSKMTQRQKRRRQDYLNAFDQCCRFIPCWIATSSQISDYLPPECLFDLVIIDEASQSDVTILPGMLRGKQWLIVGDGKQVSPTESFVSEHQIENLRAALPSSPLDDSLLPGQSFFDLCAQAFPKGRVVLREHFRCAEEIIAFSNEQFYDGRLVPLRLPTKSERLSPSIVDVKVPNGVKVRKVNEGEANEIVRQIRDLVRRQAGERSTPRSIGVISLIGDEQSRLIRGRLLDVIGPHMMARHDILVGDPPTFQGAERDIIFLSMICSPGSVPTQNQLMHVQRANVAMSRARDRCVLVRSIELTDVPNDEDVKLPIIEFFASAAAERSGESETGEGNCQDGVNVNLPGVHSSVQTMLRGVLRRRGFSVRGMGVVWKNALCVEHPTSDARAAIMVDSAGESLHEWLASYSQQKAIERVGWKCLRVDALSLLCDFKKTMLNISQLLAGVGIEEPVLLYDTLEDDNDKKKASNNAARAGVHHHDDSHLEDGSAGKNDLGAREHPDHSSVVVISSDEGYDGEEKIDVVMTDAPVPDPLPSCETGHNTDDGLFEPSQFGQVVELNFLRCRGGQQGRDPNDDGAEQGFAGSDVGSSPSLARIPHHNHSFLRRSNQGSNTVHHEDPLLQVHGGYRERTTPSGSPLPGFHHTSTRRNGRRKTGSTVTDARLAQVHNKSIKEETWLPQLRNGVEMDRNNSHNGAMISEIRLPQVVSVPRKDVGEEISTRSNGHRDEGQQETNNSSTNGGMPSQARSPRLDTSSSVLPKDEGEQNNESRRNSAIPPQNQLSQIHNTSLSRNDRDKESNNFRKGASPSHAQLVQQHNSFRGSSDQQESNKTQQESSKIRKGSTPPAREARNALHSRESSSTFGEDAVYQGDQSDAGENHGSVCSSTMGKRKRPYRRLDKYSRDGRWYPKRAKGDADDDEHSYDTDSDLFDHSEAQDDAWEPQKDDGEED